VASIICQAVAWGGGGGRKRRDGLTSEGDCLRPPAFSMPPAAGAALASFNVGDLLPTHPSQRQVQAGAGAGAETGGEGGAGYVSVGRCRLELAETRVESAWFQRLKRGSNQQFSSFAYNFNLRHYIPASGQLSLSRFEARCALALSRHLGGLDVERRREVLDDWGAAGGGFEGRAWRILLAVLSNTLRSLADIARLVIQRTLDPRLLSSMTPYDAASTFRHGMSSNAL